MAPCSELRFLSEPNSFSWLVGAKGLGQGAGTLLSEYKTTLLEALYGLQQRRDCIRILGDAGYACWDLHGGKVSRETDDVDEVYASPAMAAAS